MDSQDQAKPMVGVGSIIPKSYAIETGADGQLVGLLSNGTLLTLTENTRMRVSNLSRSPLRMMGGSYRICPVNRVNLKLSGFGFWIVGGENQEVK